MRASKFLGASAIMLIIALLPHLAWGASVDFSQCSNENPTLNNCKWIGSILNAANSEYREGMSVPQRLILRDIAATGGSSHTLTFSHQTTKGGIHAYDYLTAWNQGNSPLLTLNPCSDLPATYISICNGLRSSGYEYHIIVPDDPYISKDGSTQMRINAYEASYGNREIILRGNQPILAANLQLAHSVAAGADAGDSDIRYTLTWTSQSTQVMVEMGGHLAISGNTSMDWGWGLGASQISGGPYHFNLGGIDSGSLGSLDNQIMGSSIIPLYNNTNTTNVTNTTNGSGPPTIAPNPVIPRVCALDVVLIIDSSESIDTFELSQMQQAYQVFVKAFLPSTNTQIAVVDFDNFGKVLNGYTSDPAIVNASIMSTASGGFTNWEDALEEAHLLYDNRQAVPDLFIFASDGNPNRIGNLSILADENLSMERAIGKANAIKYDGIRIITIGIGNQLKPDNLAAISSPDAVYLSDFSTLAGTLAEIASDYCSPGSVVVRKNVNGTPAAGWQFTATGSGVTPSTIINTTDPSGKLFFSFSVNAGATSVLSITEQATPGYNLSSAACWSNGIPVGSRFGLSMQGVPFNSTANILCEFNNTAITNATNTSNVTNITNITNVTNTTSDITCLSPKYLLHSGQVLDIPFSAIFTASDPYSAYDFTASSPSRVKLQVIASSAKVTAEENNLNGEQTGTIKIQSVSNPADTKTCPITFHRLAANCDSISCRACTDFACLESNSCLDGLAFVLDPATPVRLGQFVSVTPAYSVASFNIFDPRYTVTPTSGPVSQIFSIAADATVPDGHRTAGRFTVNVAGYANGPAYVCPGLQRWHKEIGAPVNDLDSDLLVTSSRPVFHYFEKDGIVTMVGPYVFTAKVWVR
jgi:hypothetical protein